MTDPGRVPTWQEGTETLLAKLPHLVAEGEISVNDARVITYLAGLLPDPGKPVPNDDPDCRCLLNPETVPAGFIEVGFSVPGGAPSRVAYDPRCPDHGALVRALSGASGPYSIGRQQ